MSGWASWAIPGKEAGGRTEPTNSVTYLGPDLRLRLPNVEVLLEYVRTDGLQSAVPAEPPRTTRATPFLAEAIFSPWGEQGRTFFTLAWNRVNSTLDSADHNALTLNVNHLIRRNLKWVAEYTHDFERDDHRWLTGIVTAF